MEYDVDIQILSEQFLNAYPPALYPELLKKSGRPYVCLLIDTHDGYLICIPFRSSIQHKNAYMFRSTERSKKSRSGLDYSKAVLIRNAAFLSNETAVVDQDEYTEAVRNLRKIVSEITDYIDTYVNHINGTKIIHPREFLRKYAYSTLPYFHDILGLPPIKHQ